MKINITRRIVFDGKEYHSVEEMPAEARAAYERAMSALGHPEAQDGVTSVRTAIRFNGKEYVNVGAMPPGIRLLYKAAITSLGSATAPAERVEPGLDAAAPADDAPDVRPIEPTSGRLGWRMIVIPLALLLLVLFAVGRILGHR